MEGLQLESVPDEKESWYALLSLLPLTSGTQKRMDGFISHCCIKKCECEQFIEEDLESF